MVELPAGYETVIERGDDFYHAVFAPKRCSEDHCEYCKYNREDDCSFKPRVLKVSPERVAEAIYTLTNLTLDREAAEKEVKKDDKNHSTV